MFQAIFYFISFVASTISYDKQILTIINENTISSSQIIEYNDALICTIISNNDIKINENAFNNFGNLINLSISCKKIIISKSSFQDCSKIKYLIFNSPILNIDLGSFPIPIEAFIYQGENFDSNMISFITNNINELIINITGNCNFNEKENEYFQKYITNIFVNAKNVHFNERSMKSATMKKLIINAVDSINVGIGSIWSCKIKECNLNAGNIIDISQFAFSDGFFVSTHLSLNSNGLIKIESDAFHESNIFTTIILARQNISIGQESFSECSCSKISINSQESNIYIGSKTFSESTIEYVEIISYGDTIFGEANSNLVSDQTIALLNSIVINNFNVSCQGMVTFNHYFFRSKTYFQYFIVRSNYGITFKYESFDSSDVRIVLIYSGGPIHFEKNIFSNCKLMELLSLTTNSNVTFDSESFSNSYVQEMTIFNFQNDDNILKESTNYGIITFGKRSFISSKNLNRIQIKTKGDVFIDENSFENNQVLSTVIIKAGGKLHIGNNAFKKSFSGAVIQIDSSDNDISRCARGGSCKKKLKLPCSHEDEKDIPKSGSTTLGNIKIQTAYLGLTSTIYLNLNVFTNIMKKARKIFGHIIPPPDFVHSAIWVGESDANDDCIGAIFVYGKYYNKFNDNSYLVHDGVRSYPMTLREFKNKYSTDIIKLKPKKIVNLFEFIDNLKNSGKLTVNDYNWPANNCQHFTAKCLNILKAIREIPNKNDWISVPKPIMNTLEINEKENSR